MNGNPAGSPVASNALGHVMLTLVRTGEYRLVEIVAPEGYATPTGYWIIRANAGNITGIESVGGNPNFVLIDGHWYVGNERVVPFIFHKTDDQIYNVQDWDRINDFLLSGATFELYRFNGDSPGNVIITPDMVGQNSNQWQRVGDFVTSTGNPDEPIVFEIIPGRVYQLVETQAPSGFEMPGGQWRIVADDDGSFTIIAIGDTTIPAFVNIGDGYYVGNRPITMLPISGGTGRGLFTLVGIFLILLAFGAMLYRAKVSKQQM